jgi:hypothetical protein
MRTKSHTTQPKSKCARNQNVAHSTAGSTIRRMQNSIGNEAVQRLVSPPTAGDVSMSPGQPLPEAVRQEMESRLGHDFADVRIHTDLGAVKSAEALHANAYTIGAHVAFGAGQFAPNSQSGEHLLAHELAHVVQQSRGGMAPSSSTGALEAGAESAAASVVSGSGPVSVSGASSPGVARQQAMGKERKRDSLPQVGPSSAVLIGYDVNGQPVYGVGDANAAPANPAANDVIDEVTVHGTRPPRPPKVTSAPPTAPARAAPAPAAAPPKPDAKTPPPAPDPLTQTEWVFETDKHSLVPMIKSYDTGSDTGNFVVNKVLLPWRNLLAAVENMPFEILGAIDDAMRHSPVAPEWQAFQDMAPIMEAPAALAELPEALLWLRGALRARKAESLVEAAPTLVEAPAEAKAAYDIIVKNGRPVVRFGEEAPTLGYRPPPVLEEPFPSPIANTPPPQVLPEEFVNVDGNVYPRQLSLHDIHPAIRGPGKAPMYSNARTAEWNKLMLFLYDFTPRAGETYEMNGILYSFDAEKRLVRVATDKQMMGLRVPKVASTFPNMPPGYDYGHVGAVKAFGTNDYLIQQYGGFPQEAIFNREGAWRIAEDAMNSKALALQAEGKPFVKVAEVRNFVNGIPSEWRLSVTSGGQEVFNSGWLKAPAPTP